MELRVRTGKRFKNKIKKVLLSTVVAKIKITKSKFPVVSLRSIGIYYIG